MKESKALRRAIELQYRFLDWWRHPASREVARAPGRRGDFEALRHHDYCLLVTFKRNGEGIATPVSCGVDREGRAYVRSEPHVAKVRRVRADPRVRLAPCSLRGRPLGPAVEGRARLLSEPDASRADRVMRAAYGRAQALLEGAIDRVGLHMVYIEISPEGPAPSARRPQSQASHEAAETG